MTGRKILAIANQKGGVGKTTTGINLAAALAKTRRRALLIDLDPQGNATTGSGVDWAEVNYTIYDVLMGKADLSQAIVSGAGGFDVVAADADLAGAQVELLALENREFCLHQAMEPLQIPYSHILIDCPPSLNILTLNALVAADSVLIPLQCEYFALEGLSALVGTIRKIREKLNPHLQIEGLLRTMYDGRTTLTREVSEQLKTHFGDKVFRTLIPRNIRIAEAPSYGKPVLSYDLRSTGAQAYLALAGELLRREDESRQQPGRRFGATD